MSLEDSGLLIKIVTQTINKVKQQKGDFLDMLSGRLGASLLGIIVAQKRAKRREANITRFRIIREMINLS